MHNRTRQRALLGTLLATLTVLVGAALVVLLISPRQEHLPNGPISAESDNSRSEWKLGRASSESGVDIELAYVHPVRIRARAVDESGSALEHLQSYAGLAGNLYGGGELRPIHEMAHFPDGVIEWVCHSSFTDDTEEPVEIRIEVEGQEGRTRLEWEGTIPALSAGTIHDLGDVTLEAIQKPAKVDEQPMRSVKVLALDRLGQPLPHRTLLIAEIAGNSKGFNPPYS